jgi:hypothetical protein
MKQTLSFLLVLILFSTVSFAQSAISVGGNLALPIGDWSDVADMGFGGTASYEHKFSPNLVGTATAGYLIWGGKEDIEGFSYDYSAIPILAGVKYFFAPGQGFYAAGQVGLHMFTIDVDVEFFGFEGSGSSTETEFSAAAGLGYEIPVGPKGAVDLNAMFNLISDLNYLGFRVAYKFGLN